MLVSGVKRFATSFISLPTIGADSKAAFELGNITKRVIKIPLIHTTIPITWMKWLNAGTHRLILHLRSRSYANRPKGTEIFLYTPIPFGDAVQCSTYLDFLVFFLPLAGFSLVCFSGMHPQPQPFFFSAILITSFLFKRLSNHLNFCTKKLPTIL